MADATGLTVKYRRFADEYIITQNASEAARKAGYKGKNVAVTACKLLKYPKISSYIKERIKELEASIEVRQEEIKGYWKSLMLDEKANHSDRLRASEYLAKEKGMFKENNGVVALFRGIDVKDMREALEASKPVCIQYNNTQVAENKEVIDIKPLAVENEAVQDGNDVSSGEY